MDFQCVFWNGRTEKHQTSTARFRLAEENGQHRPFPSLACVLPHPLQNRVPRGERAPVALCCEPTEPAGETKSFCPCQKSQVSLLRYLTFSLVSGKIWQQGLPAGPPAVRVVGACSPVGCVQARPRRQPRQVLLPLPKSRRKHWVFAGFLFACVAWLCGSLWFKLWLFPSGFTRSQPFSSPLAPKTHPVSPFSGFSGCVFLFFAVFRPQNFCPGFCASCRIAFTN